MAVVRLAGFAAGTAAGIAIPPVGAGLTDPELTAAERTAVTALTAATVDGARTWFARIRAAVDAAAGSTVAGLDRDGCIVLGNRPHRVFFDRVGGAGGPYVVARAEPRPAGSE